MRRYVQEQAAVLFRNLSLVVPARQTILDVGGHRRIIAAMEAHVWDARVQVQCCVS